MIKYILLHCLCETNNFKMTGNMHILLANDLSVNFNNETVITSHNIEDWTSIHSRLEHVVGNIILEYYNLIQLFIIPPNIFYILLECIVKFYH